MVPLFGARSHSHAGGVLAREHADVLQFRAGPPTGSRTAGGDQDSAARAAAQPTAVPEDRGVVGVVEHQKPGLGGAVEIVPHEIGRGAVSLAGGQQFTGKGTSIGRGGEHAGP